MGGTPLTNVAFYPGSNTFTGIAPDAYPDDGPHSIQYRVQCGQFAAFQTLTFAAASFVTIQAPPTLVVTPGVPFTATIKATSYPTTVLSLSYGALPFGLSFKDNGDGTATISGTTYLTSFSCSLASCPNVFAANTVGSAQALLNFSILYTPPSFSSPAAATSVLVANDQTTHTIPVVLNNGSATKLTATVSGNLYSKVSFTDNGDGTGQFQYLDTFNFPENVTATVTATPCCGPSVVETFLIAGTEPTPRISSIKNGPLSFVVGAPDLSASYPRALTSNINNSLVPVPAGPLPTGLSVYRNGGDVSPTTYIQGVPPAGTGGLYHIPFTVAGDVAADDQTQTVDLAIYEAPSYPVYSGTNQVVFHLGVPASFNVRPVSGFPIGPFISASLGIGSSSGISYALDPSLTGGLTGTPFSVKAGSGSTPDGSATLFYSGAALANGSNFTLPLITQVSTGPVGALNGQTYQTATYTATGSVPVQIFVAIPGDANLDGNVDCTDFAMVRAAIGQRRGMPLYSSAVDLNGDGVIDARDLIIVTRHTQAGMCH